jgi:hypothetical protein
MSDPQQPLELWLWEYTDSAGKRRRTTYLLTEDDARQRYGESVTRVPNSLERRTPLGHTSAWQKRP